MEHFFHQYGLLIILGYFILSAALFLLSLIIHLLYPQNLWGKYFSLKYYKPHEYGFFLIFPFSMFISGGLSFITVLNLKTSRYGRISIQQETPHWLLFVQRIYVFVFFATLLSFILLMAAGTTAYLKGV